MYMKTEGGRVVFLVLYVDDILLLGSDIGLLSTVKVWLAKTFDMKDLGEANYIPGIKLHRDRKNRMIGLSQDAYIVRYWYCLLCKISRRVSHLLGMK